MQDLLCIFLLKCVGGWGDIEERETSKLAFTKDSKKKTWVWIKFLIQLDQVILLLVGSAKIKGEIATSKEPLPMGQYIR